METGKQFTLLIVDDEEAILASLRRIFKKGPLIVYSAKSGEEALAIMDQTRVDAAIIDLKMRGMDGLTLLQKIKNKSVLTKVLMLTGHGGVKDAVSAISFGALDFLEKPFCANELRKKILKIADSCQLYCQVDHLLQDLRHRFDYSKLIGESPAMLEIKDLIAQVSNSDASVLIQGESGTGKELVAMAIHHHSQRKQEHFVPVDCAALGDGLMQSELFGHSKGAFTGAVSANSGLIRSAHMGTLFLDEIGELDLPLQSRLLRTLQQRMVRPVGSSQLHEVDVRVVSATNRHVATEVAKGRFREDLYYRLNTVLIELPPLRDRREDIPVLTDFFMNHFCKEDTCVKSVSDDAMECLNAYSWPGNVRELSNVLCRATLLSHNEEIKPTALPREIWNPIKNINKNACCIQGNKLEDYEKHAIENALSRSANNRRRAAMILGIGEATLYRKLKKYNLF